MHDSVLKFGRSVLTREMVEGKRVLEVGSLNVNGSLRADVEAMKPESYLGIDLQEGPGVDSVNDIASLPVWVESIDLIICTEMLEHAPDWRAAVTNMKRALKPGGWLLLTTRSPGFPLHEYPGDHWRFSVADMERIFDDWLVEELESDPQAPGVFVLASKYLDASTETPVDLSTIEVHSMHTPGIVDLKARESYAGPMFSIIHPTARPDKWQAVQKEWIENARGSLAEIEYILVCDKRWGFEALPTLDSVWNTGRRCYVDAVNIGAQYATGQVLIVIADDQFPCEGWDLKIAETLADNPEKRVVEVSTGTPQEHERGILVMPILTRARYEQLGYVFFPQYESMFADNDFCESARKDDEIADARHLLFPHRHPYFDTSVSTDAAYEAQNRPEAYQLGGAVLQARRAANFGTEAKREKICVFLPGENFSSTWAARLFDSLVWLGQFFVVETHWAFCSNVYQCRAGFAQYAKKSDADYVLWVDDDNPVSPDNLKHLITDLKTFPEIDVVSGWCGCHANIDGAGGGKASVGFFNKEDVFEHADRAELEAAEGIVKIDATGFPVVLMRGDVLRTLDNPFMPIINPANPYGFDSEDISFSKRCRAAGLKLACDPRVKVPHLKLRDADLFASTPAPAGDLATKEKQ